MLIALKLNKCIETVDQLKRKERERKKQHFFPLYLLIKETAKFCYMIAVFVYVRFTFESSSFRE
jgi:hypothetical protein